MPSDETLHDATVLLTGAPRLLLEEEVHLVGAAEQDRAR
jgi:hypothetical protein